MADIKQITLPNGDVYTLKDEIARASIAFGAVDAASTSSAFTAQIEGISSYYDGLTVMLKNGVVTSTSSTSGFTIDINSLGAKPVYNNMTASTRETTVFNINYTMMFVYDSTRVEGGCWICYRGYDSDTNTDTIGYSIRTKSTTLPMSSSVYKYRLLFTSASGSYFVPANNSSSTSPTDVKTPTTEKIDPFGRIFYYGSTASLVANQLPGTSYLWEQYVFTLGYSFRTSTTTGLTANKPVYLRCTPQSDGSVKFLSPAYSQSLPTSYSSVISLYWFLGIAVSTADVELALEHPIYYRDQTGIRLWTGKTMPSTASDVGAMPADTTIVQSVTINPDFSTGQKLADITVDGATTSIYAPAGTVQVNADWAASTGVSSILNKPAIPSITAISSTVIAEILDGTYGVTPMQPSI